MRKLLFLCVVLLIAGSLAFAGGGGQQSSGTSSSTALSGPGDWNYKYPQPVTVTIGRGASNLNYFDGENFENSIYSKWVKDTWNIEYKIGFLADDSEYIRRSNLAIASGDIPDLLHINNRLQLMELVENGMVEDLTGLFDKWASPLWKAQIESHDGLQNAMSTCFMNGRQYANTTTQPAGQDVLFWVREDWRLKLGLPEPKTLNDFIKLAEAFVANDMAGNKMTCGFEINPPLHGNYNSVLNAEPFFMEAGAYPRVWIEGNNRKLLYGSVAPQVKEGLRTLRDLYARGLIAKDYVTKDHRASIAAGYPGIIMGAWWINRTWMNTTFDNNPNAIWVVYDWTSNKTGKRHTYDPNVNTSWLVVRKGYNHPEIATRLMNITAEIRCYWDGNLLTQEEEKKYNVIIPENVRNAYKGRAFISWNSWPINIQVDWRDYMARLAASDQRNVDSFKAGNTAGLDAPTMVTVQNIARWENGSRDWDAQVYYQRYKGKMFSLSDAKTIDIKKTYYPAETETMQARWANLVDLENLSYNRIIMGQESLDYFDNFVRQWNDQGGTKITEEVNKQYGR